LGESQVFVRLAGCPLRCVWCDTPGSLSAKGHPSLSVEDVLRRVRRVAGPARTVSVTGGEPLAQADFLSELFPALKKRRWKVYLETAGVHPEALARVIRHTDVVSMDIKLPSAVGRPYWKEHAEFLRIAGKKAFVKIVVTSRSRDAEIKKAFGLVAAFSLHTPVVIQPVTRRGKESPPSPEKISFWFAMAWKRLSDVRVAPQMHPIWGIR
jgi:organic radical activating enzyme